MKKKIISGLLVVALMICGFMGVGNFHPEERSITINKELGGNKTELKGQKNGVDAGQEAGFKVEAKGAVLIDAFSGKVLFAQNAEKELPPASVTKIMTMLLILEGVEQGRISLDDAVTVSENASSMGGSQMYLEPGEQHTVEELLMGVAMVSANDACVALAEHLCGTVEIFIENMNKRAKELGMDNSNFVNTNGLPEENHYSSAYDIALMTKELLEHESSHEWLTRKQAVIKIGLPGKEKEFELINSNKLLYQYEGALGVKTGFTQDAMFCLSGAAERDGTRLIAVVLGSESSIIRFSETKKLLDYGFSNYETVTVAEKGKIMKKSSVKNGTPEKVNAVTADNCGILIAKGDEQSIKTKVKISNNLKVPLKKGQKIGDLTVYYKGAEAGRFPLVAEKNVRKATLWERTVRWIKKIMPGEA